jgi:hypothetical protein
VFLTLGFMASRAVGNVTEIPVAARIVGAVALLSVVGFIIGHGRKCNAPCPLPSGCRLVLPPELQRELTVVEFVRLVPTDSASAMQNACF